MSDENTTSQDVDDTSGHVLRGAAAQEPATGGSAAAFAPDDAEDTEGHVMVRKLYQTTGDDADAAAGGLPGTSAS